MLRILVRNPKPLRPTDLSERMGISLQQVSNLGQKLDTADLIIRQRHGSRSTWLFPTTRGIRLVGLLPEPAARPEADTNDQPAEVRFWDPAALARDVRVA
jgi:DNA-binding MarR family transcriptional regulator